MTTFFVYLMPYHTRAGDWFYCGHTDNPARREREHLGRDRRQYTGRLRVLRIYDTRKAAMHGELELKAKKASYKRIFYPHGFLPEDVPARLVT
jgi:predicted GIY-YIG superfamily endonuclease